MRILHIVTKLELGGAQQTTLASVAHVQDEGMESWLATGRGGLLDEHASEVLGDKLEFVDALVRPIRPLKDWQALRQLRKLIARLKPDIVHTHSSKAGVLGRYAAYLEKVPVILHTVHGFGFHPFQPGLVNFIYRRLEKWAGRFTTGLILVSKADRAQAIALSLVPEQDMFLIRSGAPLQDFLFSPENRKKIRQELQLDDQPLVITVACLKPQKDPLTWLAAAMESVSQIPDVHFAIAGDGELKNTLEDRLAGFDQRHRIHLLGWRDDISALLSAGDLFYLPSLWEGLPKAILQAIASGLSVVASEIPGNSETAELGNVTLVPPGQSGSHREALLQNLGKLTSVPKNRLETGQESLQNSLRNFRQDRMLKQLRQLYQKVCVSSPKGLTHE